MFVVVCTFMLWAGNLRSHEVNAGYVISMYRGTRAAKNNLGRDSITELSDDVVSANGS